MISRRGLLLRGLAGVPLLGGLRRSRRQKTVRFMARFAVGDKGASITDRNVEKGYISCGDYQWWHIGVFRRGIIDLYGADSVSEMGKDGWGYLYFDHVPEVDMELVGEHVGVRHSGPSQSSSSSEAEVPQKVLDNRARLEEELQKKTERTVGNVTEDENAWKIDVQWSEREWSKRDNKGKEIDTYWSTVYSSRPDFAKLGDAMWWMFPARDLNGMVHSFALVVIDVRDPI